MMNAVSRSARPVTTRLGGAWGAPSALRRSASTTLTFTNADSMSATSGTSATATTVATVSTLMPRLAAAPGRGHRRRGPRARRPAPGRPPPPGPPPPRPPPASARAVPHPPPHRRLALGPRPRPRCRPGARRRLALGPRRIRARRLPRGPPTAHLPRRQAQQVTERSRPLAGRRRPALCGHGRRSGLDRQLGQERDPALARAHQQPPPPGLDDIERTPRLERHPADHGNAGAHPPALEPARHQPQPQPGGAADQRQHQQRREQQLAVPAALGHLDRRRRQLGRHDLRTVHGPWVAPASDVPGAVNPMPARGPPIRKQK